MQGIGRATIEELSMQQQRFDDESDDGPNSGFTEQSKFLVRRESIYDLESESSSGATHVPIEPLLF